MLMGIGFSIGTSLEGLMKCRHELAKSAKIISEHFIPYEHAETESDLFDNFLFPILVVSYFLLLACRTYSDFYY